MTLPRETGQLTPLLALLVLGLVVSMLGLGRLARGTVLATHADTAAEAAALAAAAELRAQIEQQANETSFDTPTELDHVPARAAAERFADRNGAELTGFVVDGLQVTVDVRGVGTIGGPAPHARVTARASAIVERGEVAAGTDEPWGVTARRAEAVASRAHLADVRPDSVLLTATGRGDGPEPSVSGLRPQMITAIARVEEAMDAPLRLTSGYRSAEYQQRLCAQLRLRSPGALCAPPGRSLHQAGLAIDVADPAFVLEAIRRDPQIPLCQPYPARDAVHFSHRTTRECGGAVGTGDAPAPPIVSYRTRLVPTR